MSFVLLLSGMLMLAASVRCQSGCTSSCTTCQGGQNCTQCSQGTYLNLYANGNGYCVSCGVGCQNCNSPSTCGYCSPGYVMTSTYGCARCPDNCYSCNNQFSCSSCYGGYYSTQYTNGSYYCSSSSAAMSAAATTLIVLGSICGLCCLIICCIAIFTPSQPTPGTVVTGYYGPQQGYTQLVNQPYNPPAPLAGGKGQYIPPPAYGATTGGAYNPPAPAPQPQAYQLPPGFLESKAIAKPATTEGYANLDAGYAAPKIGDGLGK